MNIKNNSLVKVLSVLCATVMIFTALFANPVIISALTGGSDDSVVGKEEVFDTPVVYGFEPSEDPVTDKSVNVNSLNMTRGGDNMGVMGWTWDITDGDAEHGRVLYTHNEPSTQTWATAGGYRLNNSNGVYRLKKDTTYYVEMSVNLTAAPSVEGSASEVYLGYGSWDNKADGNTNGVDSMGVKLYTVVKAEKDAQVYSVTSTEGTKEYEVNSGWHNLKFVFTTPSDFKNTDNALALYSTLMPGAKIQIDNVKVTPVAEDEGVVLFKDDFHSNTIIAFDDINKEVELPVLTPENPEHTFEGWYYDYNRTDDTKVESYKMVDGITTFYARFKAPVTITFINTLTNTQDVISGLPTTAIPYPAFPSDSEKQFAGWFTTEDYTEEYFADIFAYANIVLYSKWIDPVQSSVEDFETYTKHQWEEITVSTEVRDEKGQPVKDENGVVEKVDATYKSNYLYFGRMCDLSDFGYADSNHSLKFSWDADMMLDPADPETYYALGRHNQVDAATILEDVSLTNNTTYIVSFKYYVAQINANLNVSFYSGNFKNVWGNMASYQSVGNSFTVTPDKNDGQWHEAQLVITTNFKGDGKAMFVNVNMSQNSDAVMYLDDFVFTPLKPTESYIVYNHGVENDIYCGEIRTTLPHAVANPDKKFTSYKWYSDSTFITPFNETVYTREPMIAYAMKPITFKYDYPYTTEHGLAFGYTMEIVNEKGVGNGDDYVLKCTYDGDVFLRKNTETGKDVYWRDRYNSPDFQALAKTQLKDDTVYIISYDVKATVATLDYSVQFSTAASNNVWGGFVWPTSTKTTFSKSTTKDGWMSCTTAIKTKEKLDYANALYIFITFAHNLKEQHAEVYIDNLMVSEAIAPLAVFVPNNETSNIVVSGKAGNTIKYPDAPVKFGYDFSGWYLDKECTKPFTATTFAENEIYYVYAGYTESKVKTFDYEDYNVPYAVPSEGHYRRHDCEVVEVPFAYSGTHVMKGDRSFARNPELNTGGSGHLLQSGSTVQKLSQKKNYIITFKYYIETHGQEPLRVSAYAGSNVNFWGSSKFANTYYINLDEQTGVWHTGTLVCDGSKINQSWQDHLYFNWTVGTEGMYYFDDVTITELEEGEMAYFIDNGGCKNIPEYVKGKEGESFASQLPKNPKYENHQFLGYFVLGDDGKYQQFTDMKFYADKTPAIVARFIRLKTIQDFETFYAPAIAAMSGYSILDYDYELYDALAKGNSRENVTSGRYSLHRLGKTHYFENALLLTSAQQLAAGEKYTVTFKVKMPSYLQTDGAVKIVSNNSPIFAWATMGDYYPVVAVKDLTDGQWHEVSYTFIAIEPYVSIQTPGYCELFVDDVVFNHVSADTEVSVPVQFTEYVPAKRDLVSGELVTTVTEAGNVDVSTIIDDSLVEGSFGSSSSVTVIIICAVAAVVVLAAVVIILLVIKKKKKA